MLPPDSWGARPLERGQADGSLWNARPRCEAGGSDTPGWRRLWNCVPNLLVRGWTLRPLTPQQHLVICLIQEAHTPALFYSSIKYNSIWGDLDRREARYSAKPGLSHCCEGHPFIDSPPYGW